MDASRRRPKDGRLRWDDHHRWDRRHLGVQAQAETFPGGYSDLAGSRLEG